MRDISRVIYTHVNQLAQPNASSCVAYCIWAHVQDKTWLSLRGSLEFDVVGNINASIQQQMQDAQKKINDKAGMAP